MAESSHKTLNIVHWNANGIRDKIPELTDFVTSHTEQPIETNDLESHAIRLSDDTLIVSCYDPPQVKLNTSDLDKILNANNKVIAIGDFNSKHTMAL
ncbi:Protein of unknown function [Cotesia congregata]|uniref:Endonuclease/exonuclease/phosphatase domain-containing protein n=1 Tax=Cotesia congregata TaxID=51543 RepID=A0A8J2HI71_COTCN|nr:Protein of unknown function [Cotesia congregata]